VAKERVKFDRKSGAFEGMTDEEMERIKKLYPNVNVHVELGKMCAWLLSPAGVRRQGTLSFVCRWLSRVQASVPATNGVVAPKLDPTLTQPLNTYLDALWLNREYLLALNTKNR